MQQWIRAKEEEVQAQASISSLIFVVFEEFGVLPDRQRVQRDLLL
jgi:hypothetical protein